MADQACYGSVQLKLGTEAVWKKYIYIHKKIVKVRTPHICDSNKANPFTFFVRPFDNWSPYEIVFVKEGNRS